MSDGSRTAIGPLSGSAGRSPAGPRPAKDKARPVDGEGFPADGAAPTGRSERVPARRVGATGADPGLAPALSDPFAQRPANRLTLGQPTVS
jgi:hypothetical protein